jgi:hypothetical protein
MDLERVERILKMVILHPNSKEYRKYAKELSPEEKEVLADLRKRNNKLKRDGNNRLFIKSSDVFNSVISGW